MTPDSYKGITKEFQKAYKHSEVTKNAITEELNKIKNEITMLLFFDRPNVLNIIEKHIREVNK